MNKIILVLIGMCITVSVCSGYAYDPNDFAIEVVDPNGYIQGLGITKDWVDKTYFDDPNAALGRPTVDSTGDIFPIPVPMAVPVNPVYQPFRSFELVTVGRGGSLTLKFSHPVADDINNPYGIDFIVFTNCQADIGNSVAWENGDPSQVVTSGEGLPANSGLVSVSYDGVNWFTYQDDHPAELFAPTLGRVYDSENPDMSIGVWNQWWGEPTNPTLPLDPAITPESIANKTVAEVAQMYGKSAGGNGYDLAETGLSAIWYVRIESNGSTPEIDAVADVSACGDYKRPFPVGDISKDCKVDMTDLAMLAGSWLDCTWNCESD